MSTTILEYHNNMECFVVGEFDFEHSLPQEAFQVIIKALGQSGHPFNPSKGRMDQIIDHEWIHIADGSEINCQGDSRVIYSEYVLADNAYSFEEKDGIVFFFHTREETHRIYPHVHARYSGKEIQISLYDFSIKGKFDNRRKMRTAVDHVKSEQEKYFQEWQRISQFK